MWESTHEFVKVATGLHLPQQQDAEDDQLGRQGVQSRGQAGGKGRVVNLGRGEGGSPESGRLR